MTFGLVSASKNDEQIEQPKLIVVEPKDFHRAIYVAASSAEIERAERVMEKLSAAGMLVTSSWARNIRQVGRANPTDVPRQQRFVWALTCLHEVSAASTLLLLYPEKPTSGAWVELGYATCLQVITHMGIQSGAVPPQTARWIVGAGREHSSVFAALCDHYDSDDAAIEAIVDVALNTNSAP